MSKKQASKPKKAARRRERERDPRGLAVNRQPRGPSNIVKTRVPVHDAVKNWSDLLLNPFTADAEGVYPPISNDVVPCPSTKVRNYGTQSLLVGASDTQINFWCYPEGTLTAQGLASGVVDTTQLNDVSSAQFGPVLTGPTSNQRATFAFYSSAPSTYTPTTCPLGGSGLGAPTKVNSAVWDTLANPFEIPSGPSDVKMRCTAFGIRISYVGKLMDTEGYVDFYNPYAWNGADFGGGSIQREMSSLRRDPSHRRYYFSNKRTHTYVWHPNCESSSYGIVDGTATYDLRNLVSRFMFRIGGIVSGDEFEIEAIGFQEFTGHPATSTNTPSPIASDMVHVANAIPELSGGMNKDDGAPRRNLEQHVAAEKVHAIPAKTKAMAGIPATKSHDDALKKVSSGVGTALSIASDFLPFLAMF